MTEFYSPVIHICFSAWLDFPFSISGQLACQGLYKKRIRAQLHSSSCIEIIYIETLFNYRFVCVHTYNIHVHPSSTASIPVTTAQAPAQESVPLSSAQQPEVETSTMEQPTVGGKGIAGESQNGERSPYLV